jgi:H+-transporting ATPase
MSDRRISYAADVENGEHPRNTGDINDTAGGLDEYSALNRYISTARDRRRGSTSSAAEVLEAQKNKKPWWAFWRKASDEYGASDEPFIPPDEWLDTDIKAGLKASDIEPRRKRTGWNELVTEHQNLFLQFLSYFQGPILYGK